jgi:uncharacterized protein (TIGR02271 family)
MAQNRDDVNERANIDTTGRGSLNDDLLNKDKASMRVRDEEVVPVVEEELAVGKRTVETGGVRVHKTTSERPVEENINLHEERVSVERRPVDRPVTAADMTAFQDETIEMREMAEEAVVEKRARVVEEVVVGKESRERTEHISDTIRRTDVEVEPLVASNTMRTGWDSVDTSCRTHFNQNYASSGWDYDSGYSHAYRYGFDLAGSGRDWSSMEGDVRTNWETKNKGTWDRFKDAIRYGFDQGR